MLLLGGSTRIHGLLFAYDSFISSPRWSPDGRHLAFLGPTPVGFEPALHHSFVASATTGELRCLTAPYEGAISAIEWVGRVGDRIMFASLENLHGAINEIDIATGEIRSRLAKRDIRHGTFGDPLSTIRQTSAIGVSPSVHAAKDSSGAGLGSSGP